MTSDRRQGNATELFLGVDAGGTALKFTVMDGAGTIRLQGEVPTDTADVERSLRGLVQRLDESLGADERSRLVGVGLACAGIVDPTRGWLGNSPNLPGWQQTALGEVLVRMFGPLPTALANDVNAALYGEHRRGAGRGAEDLVMIALGTGVGGGVMIGGA